MKRTLFRTWACLLALFLCLTACTSQNTDPIAVDETIERHSLSFANATSKTYDYDALAFRSNAVVVADVKRMTNADQGFVMTVCQTKEILKGHVAEEFVVRDSGGFRAQDYQDHGSPEDPSVIRVEWTFAEEPLMRSGNRVLLFLVDNGCVTQSGTRYYELAIGPASKFFFDPADNRYHNALLYSGIYREFLAQAPSWAFTEHTLTDMTPKTLDEIKGAIHPDVTAYAFPEKTASRVEVQPDRYIEHPVCSVDLLTSLSSHVIYGEVIAREQFETDLRTVSLVRVRVRDVLHGTLRTQEDIYVEDTGYIGDRLSEETECTLWGEPLLREGHRVVLFLCDPVYTSSEYDSCPAFSLTEQELGKYFVDAKHLCHPAMRLSRAYRKGNTLPHALDYWEPLTIEQLYSRLSK